MIKKVNKTAFAMLVIAAAVLTGCFKKVSRDTLFLIKPNLQVESGGELTVAEGVKAYAWFNRTEPWSINSYEDAERFILTDSENGATETLQPDAESVTLSDDGKEGLLELDTKSASVLLLVLYPEAGMYAWRVFETSENASPTYLTVQLRTWKTDVYVDSGWTVGRKETEVLN